MLVALDTTRGTWTRGCFASARFTVCISRTARMASAMVVSASAGGRRAFAGRCAGLFLTAITAVGASEKRKTHEEEICAHCFIAGWSGRNLVWHQVLHGMGLLYKPGPSDYRIH